MGRPAYTKESVWKFIKVAGKDECWEWLGTKSPFGYGKIAINWRSCRAHRVVYELSNGVELKRNRRFSSDSDIVMHSCDNPGCCNPKHLFLGKPSDNIWDMVRKGRRHNFDGERGQRSKLTNEQAKEIYIATWNKVPHQGLADKYGVSCCTISSIKYGKVYGTATKCLKVLTQDS
jgi:hypothetical protein